jgi:hypothetical protein
MLWRVPGNLDIPALVRNLVGNREYLWEIWPALKVVMNRNLPNNAWTAMVATTMSFMRVISMLPEMEEVFGSTFAPSDPDVEPITHTIDGQNIRVEVDGNRK